MSTPWSNTEPRDSFALDMRLEELIVGESMLMRRVKQAIATVAPSDAPVLVTGPTGAGKEMAARALHVLSGREGALVPVNCGAIPADLLESELFGHEKGAFTGAAERRQGLIEQADGGTLFLDEIGEMPLQLQAKLLRALENRAIQRVGGGQEIAVNFRLVCATNRDLHSEVLQGRFREDLLYRIDVFALRMPGLGEHTSDIPLILRAMARNSQGPNATGGAPLKFDHSALQALAAHDWPGNVRELRNVFERARVLFAGRNISAQDVRTTLLRAELTPDMAPETPQPAASPATSDTGSPAALAGLLQAQGSIDMRSYLQKIEERVILTALELCNGRVTQAADMLRLKRTTLIGKLQKLGIDRSALVHDGH